LLASPQNAQAQPSCTRYCYDCILGTNAIITRSPGNTIILPQDCGWVWCNGCEPTFASAQQRALNAVDQLLADEGMDLMAHVLIDDAAIAELNVERRSIQLRNCENRVTANFPLSEAAFRRLTTRVAAVAAERARGVPVTTSVGASLLGTERVFD
jgi:hypothetical protein